MIANVLIILLSLTGADVSCMNPVFSPPKELKTPGEVFKEPLHAFQHDPSFIGTSLWPSIQLMRAL